MSPGSCAPRFPRARSLSRPRRRRRCATSSREAPSASWPRRRHRPPGAPRTARAQSQLVKLLDGGGGALTTTNGEVVLDLHPIVERVAGRVGGGACDTGDRGHDRAAALGPAEARAGRHAGVEADRHLPRAAGPVDLRPRDLGRARPATSGAQRRDRDPRLGARARVRSARLRGSADRQARQGHHDTAGRPPCLVDRDGPAAARDHVDPVRRHRRADRRVGSRPRRARDVGAQGRLPGSCETIARGSRSRQSSSCCSCGHPRRRRATGSPWSV